MSATQARDKALEVVEAANDPAMAEAAVLAYACSNDELTSDDVRGEYGECGLTEPRAWGAVMRNAKRAGYIKPTTRFREGTRKSSHARPMRIWKSLMR